LTMHDMMNYIKVAKIRRRPPLIGTNCRLLRRRSGQAA
jgi:hypothetical protein